LFNGFVSKWHIYYASLKGGEQAPFLPLCAVIAILTSGLTLASFIKFFGTSFLGRTSALVAEKAGPKPHLEATALMVIPQVFLAALCLLFGLAPGLPLRFIELGLAGSRQGLGTLLAHAPSAKVDSVTGLSAFTGQFFLWPAVLLGVMGLMFLAASALARISHAPWRTCPPWNCGYFPESELGRYSAHGFYGEIKRYFRWLGGRVSRSTPAGARPPMNSCSKTSVPAAPPADPSR
jgi:hydrogenase-4 component B